MPIHITAEYYFIGQDLYHHNKYVDDVFMARSSITETIRAFVILSFLEQRKLTCDCYGFY